jgi:hypothetical protein
MFTRAAQAGLWFIAGSFAQCRIYSKYLALQIKACEVGLLPRTRTIPTGHAEPLAKKGSHGEIGRAYVRAIGSMTASGLALPNGLVRYASAVPSLAAVPRPSEPSAKC